MAIGGLNIKFGKMSKRTVLTSIINVAQVLLNEKTPEDNMSRVISKKVMRDPEIEYMLRGFTNRYNLYGADIKMEPKIEESSLIIENWNLMVNGKVAFTAKGCEELVRTITEYVLTRDPAKIDEAIKTLEACLK